MEMGLGDSHLIEAEKKLRMSSLCAPSVNENCLTFHILIFMQILQEYPKLLLKCNAFMQLSTKYTCIIHAEPIVHTEWIHLSQKQKPGVNFSARYLPAQNQADIPQRPFP